MNRGGTIAAMALSALVVAGCGSSTSSCGQQRHQQPAAKACKASIAIEGPFTGPVAQVGLEQLHFAQLAVAEDNKANGTNVTLAQDDTQLTPSLATTKTQSIISNSGRGRRSDRRAARRSRRSGRCSAGPGWRSSPARRRCRRWPQRREPDVLPRRPRRQRPGPAGRQLHRQPPAPQGRADRRRRGGLLAGPGRGDDPDPPEGRHQGRPRDDQRHRHRRRRCPRWSVAGHLAADRRSVRAAVAGRRQRAAVRPGLPSSTRRRSCSGPTAPTRRRSSRSRHVRVDVRARHHRRFRPTPAIVAAAWPSTVRTARSASPTYAATRRRSMQAIASVCKSGQTPSRANVLAAIKKTNMPDLASSACRSRSRPTATSSATPVFLFKINSTGKYKQIPKHDRR